MSNLGYMGGKDILCQALFWQLGRFVPYEAIEDLLWGDDEDGGPLCAHNIINQYVLALRNEGNVIENWPRRGLVMISRIAAENPDTFYRQVA